MGRRPPGRTAPVAQRIEQEPSNLSVAGSIPAGGADPSEGCGGTSSGYVSGVLHTTPGSVIPTLTAPTTASRPAPTRVLAIPSAHPYAERLRAVGPDAERSSVLHLSDPPVAGAPDGQWWPPPALDADWVHAHAGEVDVIHLHFGFDASSPDDLRRWVEALDGAGIPLVLTVHDLANPHFTDQTDHLARLDVLVPAAAAVITLTEGAAAQIRRAVGS